MGLIAVSVSDQFRSQITIRSNALFTQMKQSGMMLFNSFWVNPDQTNLSPDKTWAAMGTDAVAARHAYLGMASFVNAVVAGSLPAEPSGWSLTENADGSVTAVASA